MAEWAELSEEYQKEVVGERLLAEIQDVCKGIARRFPAGVYAVTADWRDSLDDLTDEVVALLLDDNAQQLRYIMGVARSTSDFRGLVGKHTRRVLSHGRTRTVVDNLLDRARARLQAPPFVEVGRRDGRPAYSLRDKAPLDPPSRADVVRAAAIVAKVPKARPSRSDERAPKVYTSESLKLVLEIVARTLPSAFTERDLDGIFRDVLTGWIPVLLEEDVEAADLAITDWSEDELDDVQAAASRALAGMSPKERRAVALFYGGRTHAEIADALGCSRPTAKKRLDAGLEDLRVALVDLPETMHDFAIDFLVLELFKESG